MRNAGSFPDTEVNPTDFYDQTSTLPSTATESNGVPLTPRMDIKMDMHHSQNQGRNYKVSNTSDISNTTLVHKPSRRVVSMERLNGDMNLQPPPIKEIVTGEFIHHAESDYPISLPYRQPQRQIMPRGRVQSHTDRKTPMMSTTRPQYKEEPGVSFQFYGRSGSVATDGLVPTLRGIRSGSSSSTNDSFVIGSSLMSTTRTSQYSDRFSLETNFGSFNPQHNLNTGRRIESGYAPSIQEDEEAYALQQLTGWFHASSISQDSFMLQR
ncbi:hypothetical protein PsorP6_002027 [Peronosclerospora sorghi]|uniref:Uncharacterized protein n=1 Tax=Peronosclerospora sorghi TaxID=230839 RepID=A0ACC0WWD4_9STRA|nr:hypothetical protein PsorP6_002027 [Peronosclerospora sorghi]